MERTELMEKAITGDYVTLKSLGWLEVFEALKGWWPKRMSIEDLAPYIDALYEEPAGRVMTVLRTMRGEQWRPSPSALYREIQGAAAQRQIQKDAAKDRFGNKKEPWETASALVRVRMLIEAGNPICACRPRKADMRIDRYNVLTCLDCGGLEQGQADVAVEDLEEMDF